jgi:hypothetical protein
MKVPRANNFGRLIWTRPVRRAYALHFVKFVQAYRALGLPVQAVQVPNEPDSDQKFPSCLWTGARLGSRPRCRIRRRGRRLRAWASNGRANMRCSAPIRRPPTLR